MTGNAEAIEQVDAKGSETRVAAITGTRQGHGQLMDDAGALAGPVDGEERDAVGEDQRLLDVVGDEQDGRRDRLQQIEQQVLHP